MTAIQKGYPGGGSKYCPNCTLTYEGDKCPTAKCNTTTTADRVAVKCSDELWRTLDSAPRDGTPVDLWHKDGFRMTEVWWADDVWSCVLDDDSFTHWRPIPDAP